MAGFREFLPYSIRQSTIETMEQKLVRSGVSSLRLTDPTKEPPNAHIHYGAKYSLCPICGATNNNTTVRCKKCDAFIFKKNVNGRHKERIQYMDAYTSTGDEQLNKIREQQRLEKKLQRLKK